MMKKTRWIGLLLLVLFACAACTAPAGADTASTAPAAESTAPAESAAPTAESATPDEAEPSASVPAASEAQDSAQPSDESEPDMPAHESDGEFRSLEETLTALLDVYVTTGQGHPTDDPVSSEYAAAYLFALVNDFYADEAKAVEELKDGGFDLYVEWDADYVDGVLFRAFGPAFTAKNLKETNALKILDGHYYIGVSDGGACEVQYTGEIPDEVDSAAQYKFAYTYTPEDGEKPVAGELTVYLGVDEETDMAYVAAFSVDDALDI